MDNDLVVSLAESFEIAGISRAKGNQLVKEKRWAPVRYIDSKPFCFLDELSDYLRSLPTESTSKRGGYRGPARRDVA